MKDKNEKIWIRTTQKIIAVNPLFLVFIYGTKRGCTLHFDTTREYNHASKIQLIDSLCSFEISLRHLGFLRCHRNYLINTRYFKCHHEGKNRICYEDIILPVSRRNRSKILMISQETHNLSLKQL